MVDNKSIYIGKIVCHKYRIIRYLDKGGFGVIYLGENIENNENVAIKIENLSKTR